MLRYISKIILRPSPFHFVSINLFFLAMSHLWTIPDFKEELTHLAALQQKRAGSPVVQCLVSTWCAKIQAVTTWTSSGILDIMNHVDSLSLPDDLKARLHECLEQLTIGSTQAIKVIKAGQVIHNLPGYMSPADWTHLESNATIYDHMHVIAKRLATMGVVSLRENTKAQAVALALYCQSQLGKPEPNAMVIHSCLADFQSLHTQCLSTMHQQIAGPKTYPSNPVEMGTTWLQKVYGEELPSTKQVPLAAWMNKVACRSTNKKLQVDKQATSSTSTKGGEKTTNDLLQELLAKHDKSACVAFATQGQCSSQSLATQRQIATPQSTLFVPKVEAELPVTKTVTTNEPAPAEQSATQPKNLESMEQEAFNKLQKLANTRNMKRPASKLDAKSPCPAQKGKAPAAKTKPAAKAKAKVKAKAKAKTKASLQKGKGPGCSKCRGEQHGRPTLESQSSFAKTMPIALQGRVPTQVNLVQPSGAKAVD